MARVAVALAGVDPPASAFKGLTEGVAPLRHHTALTALLPPNDVVGTPHMAGRMIDLARFARGFGSFFGSLASFFGRFFGGFASGIGCFFSGFASGIGCVVRAATATAMVCNVVGAAARTAMVCSVIGAVTMAPVV